MTVCVCLYVWGVGGWAGEDIANISKWERQEVVRGRMSEQKEDVGETERDRKSEQKMVGLMGRVRRCKRKKGGGERERGRETRGDGEGEGSKETGKTAP